MIVILQIMSWLRNRRRSSAATKEAFIGVEESGSRRGSRRFSVDFLTNQTGTDLLAKPSKQQQIPQIRVNDSKSSTQEGPLKFR